MSDQTDFLRLLTNDLGDTPSFSDAELEDFLLIEGGVLKLAAAQVLDVIASNEALVAKRIRSLDLQSDGPAVAAELRKHAAALRTQVAQASGEATDTASGAFAVTGAVLLPELAEITRLP